MQGWATFKVEGFPVLGYEIRRYSAILSNVSWISWIKGFWDLWYRKSPLLLSGIYPLSFPLSRSYSTIKHEGIIYNHEAVLYLSCAYIGVWWKVSIGHAHRWEWIDLSNQHLVKWSEEMTHCASSGASSVQAWPPRKCFNTRMYTLEFQASRYLVQILFWSQERKILNVQFLSILWNETGYWLLGAWGNTPVPVVFVEREKEYSRPPTEAIEARSAFFWM